MSTYAPRASGHAVPTSAAEIEASHKSMGSGSNLRASVFGVNDGLLVAMILMIQK